MAKLICIVTGSRADYGLLKPVMEAVRKNKGLKLSVIVSGSHFLPPETAREVDADFGPLIGGLLEMQEAGDVRTRLQDARDTAEGMAGFASCFATYNPDWVVVLGDRIEAFAAASAASIGGYGLCHIHGGDRAEGVADESMRHAISKLAHLHCAATEQSGKRLVKMGESKQRVYVTGSPAIDGLADMVRRNTFGDALLADSYPDIVLLQHPAGLGDAAERAWAKAAVASCEASAKRGVLALEPNHDAGRESVQAVLHAKMAAHDGAGKKGKTASKKPWLMMDHLPRGTFVAMLASLAKSGGVLVGNSSAGLIEAAALGVPVVNLGPRQAGRERAGNVVDVEVASAAGIVKAIAAARRKKIVPSRVYGDGRAGEAIARLLMKFDGKAGAVLRKRNAY